MGLNVLYIQSNNKNNVVVVPPKPYACNDISSCIMWTLCAATGGLGFASGGRILLLSKWMSRRLYKSHCITAILPKAQFALKAIGSVLYLLTGSNVIVLNWASNAEPVGDTKLESCRCGRVGNKALWGVIHYKYLFPVSYNQRNRSFAYDDSEFSYKLCYPQRQCSCNCKQVIANTFRIECNNER